jgi:hypothetical protein
MKTISIDGQDVEIENLSDETLLSQLRKARAAAVAASLVELKEWSDLSQKRSAEAKLRGLQRIVAKRKLQVD